MLKRLAKIMKTLSLGLLLGSSLHSLQGVTLSFFSDSTLPPVSAIPGGDHYDTYFFPISLLPSDISNPIVSLQLDYDASDVSVLGDHEIVAQFFLFSSGALTVLSDTPTFYSGRVDFSQGVTALSEPFPTAFAALHGPIGSGAFTDGTWTATYLDNSTASESFGIIPEPSVLGLGVVFILSVTSRRRR